MPRKSAVQSLKQCCFKSIALSFDKHWFQDFLQHFDDLPRLLYVIGPFDHWTNELIQDLIDVMVEQRCLRRKHFYVLLQSSLTTLNLSAAQPAANHDSVLNILSSRCPKLTSVNLSRLNSLSAKAIAVFVKTFPALKVLNLEKTKCNDQILAIMGAYCTNLVDLNVNSTPVTNSGAFSLCGGFSADRPGCTKLVKLNILYTMIDEIGASHILENLTNLRYLGFQDICGSIQHGRDLEMNSLSDLRMYQLRNVTSFTMSCEDTFTKCPFASEVSLLNGLSDSSIPLLSSLANIQILRLGNFHENILSFNNGVLPFLRQHGRKLIELELSEIGPLDVIEIARTCPNLQRFSYTNTGAVEIFHSSGLSHTERLTLFRTLTLLKVVLPRMEENFPTEALECIFCNATNLQKVHLINVRNSNKDLFGSCLSQNPLKSLSELKLENCNWVRGETILNMIKSDNDLYEVSTLKCDHVRLRDHEKVMKYVKKYEILINLEWS